MYGARWKGPLARAFGRSRVTINRWVRGGEVHGDVDRELFELIADVEQRCGDLRAAMARFLSKR
jgi:hypothetical protein